MCCTLITHFHQINTRVFKFFICLLTMNLVFEMFLSFFLENSKETTRLKKARLYKSSAIQLRNSHKSKIRLDIIYSK